MVCSHSLELFHHVHFIACHLHVASFYSNTPQLLLAQSGSTFQNRFAVRSFGTSVGFRIGSIGFHFVFISILLFPVLLSSQLGHIVQLALKDPLP